MKRYFRKVALAGVATIALIFASPMSPASAINTTGCPARDAPDEFLRVAVHDGAVDEKSYCFANRGTLAVNLRAVHYVASGNNRVTVAYELDGHYYQFTLEKWNARNLEHGNIYQLWIL
jgi:hypothetical protein